MLYGAIGGLLVLLWAGIALAQETAAQETADPSKGSEQAEHPKAKQAQTTPTPESTPPPQVAVPSKGDGYQEHSAEYYSKRDLKAQESMAESTRKLVDLTNDQVWIVGLEASLLVLTLIFTAAATRAASRAAKAADNAVEVTEDTAKQQLRAYLGIEKLEVTEPGSQGVYDIGDGRTGENITAITIKNFGSTPAYKVLAQLNFFTTQIGDQIKEDFTFPDPENQIAESYRYHNLTIIDPGHNFMGYGFYPSELRLMFTTANAVQINLFVYGHIDYTDVFNRRWRRDFCFHYSPKADPGNRFLPYSRHNDEYQIDADNHFFTAESPRH